jgi:hypothetical protein
MYGAQVLDGFVPSQQGRETSDYQRGSLLNDPGVGGRNWSNLRRPYFDKNGRPAVTLNMGRTTLDRGVQVPIKEHRTVRGLQDQGFQLPPVVNATSLRKEEWIELDRVVLKAARYRLRAVADLGAANTFGGFNGMSKLILERETMSDPGEAMVDMDGLTEGRTDGPQFQLQGLPLPITHSDFWFPSRFLNVSRNSGSPIDTNMGEAAGRRVAETLELTTIGMETGITYGGNSTYVGGYSRNSQVYGYVNFTPRLTYTTLPTPTGSNAAAILAGVLAMKDKLAANKFYGPFMCYTTNDYDQYMDNDYILTGGNVATQTLRNRIRAIEGIQDVRRLDMWFGSTPAANTGATLEIDATLKPYSIMLIQMTQEVARLVNGMDITTVQWESVGGMRLNFKVMAIQVPQLGADAYGNCGIVVGSTS